MGQEKDFEELKKETMEKEVSEKIFELVEKPKDFLFVKSSNVYHDRYRVNVYSSYQDEGTMSGYKSQRISHSYFCRYDGENLTILSA